VSYLVHLGFFSDALDLCTACSNASHPFSSLNGSHSFPSHRSRSLRHPELLIHLNESRSSSSMLSLTLSHRSRSLRHFESLIMPAAYGYADVDDYLHQNTCHWRLGHISRPLLCLANYDDPLVHGVCVGGRVSLRFNLILGYRFMWAHDAHITCHYTRA
jgi:predicted alpha/beta-fold hydrolase